MSWYKSIFNFLRFNNKNWRAVVLSVLAAMIFWFFNALNKEYTTNLNFPIAFDYNKKNYVSIEPLPEEISLNVTGVGWNLFRRSVGVNIPSLLIPLERPSEIRKIVGSTLPSFIADQLAELKINFVLTDTLFVSIEPKAGRWISLQADSVTTLLDRGYGLQSAVKIVPDSIFIEGPIGMVTGIREPYAVSLQEKNITGNFDDEVEVVFESEIIKRDPPTVHITFEVDKLTEVVDSISLELINVPTSNKGIQAIEKIACTFRMGEKRANSFRPDSIKAIVDLTGITKGKHKLVPRVIGLPGFVHAVRIDSVSIQY